MQVKKHKKRIDKPTKRMKDYVDRRIKHPKETKETSALESGYSKTTAKSVKQGIEQRKTYEQLLAKYLPDDMILKALESDIIEKPRNRIAELNLATKIKGLQTDKIDITSKSLQITGFQYIKPSSKQASKPSKDKK